MKVSFFIDRPVFSAVISIVIVIVGIIGLTMLPVDQYPQITPPVAENPPELELLDSMYSIPGVPFISCSIGVATACETVNALAPG